MSTPEGYRWCERCRRDVVAALWDAHQRRDESRDWFSQRRPVAAPRPGAGSRSRGDTEGRGRARRRWRRP
jgi:hypothetical protein